MVAKDDSACIKIPGPVTSLTGMTLSETVLDGACTLLTVKDSDIIGEFSHKASWTGGLLFVSCRCKNFNKKEDWSIFPQFI